MVSQSIATQSSSTMKTISFFAALLLSIVSAGALLHGGAPVLQAQGAGVCPDNPDPVDPGDPSIIVDTPEDGDRVTSPVTVSGRARVFEASVSITVFDSSGNPIVETFTTAEEGAPALAPFSAQVAFSSASEQPGCIRVFEASAQDGRPTNVVQVEVTLAPAMTPPKTGSAGLQDGNGGDSDFAYYAAGALLLAGATSLALRHRLWS